MSPTYSVVFFRGREKFGLTPRLEDLKSAKKFAESTLLVNGADRFAIYDEKNNNKLVFVRDKKRQQEISN